MRDNCLVESLSVHTAHIVCHRFTQHLQSGKARKWVWAKRKSVKVGMDKEKVRLSSHNVRPTEVEKGRAILLCFCCLDFKLYFYN